MTVETEAADASALDAGPSLVDPDTLHFSRASAVTLKSLASEGLSLAFSPDARAIALLGVRGFVVVDAQSLAILPKPRAAAVTHSTKPLFVLSGTALEVDTGAEVTLPHPNGQKDCFARFSADGRVAILECIRVPCADLSDGKPYVDGYASFYLVDVSTGTVTRRFADRELDCATHLDNTHASLSPSGHFIKWSVHESSWFEDLRATGLGPALAAEAELSPNDALLFSTFGRYVRGAHQVGFTGPSPARILDPRDGHAVFELATDVVAVVFSPSSRLFAAVHATIPPFGTESVPRSLTIHSAITGHQLLAVPLSGSMNPVIAFSPDDRAFALVANDSLTLYRSDRDRRLP